MRALITGAGGFVGRHLIAECLARGDDVTALVRCYPGEALAGVRYVEVDLADAAQADAAIAAAAPERVFHLAGKASVADSWRDPADTLSANLLLTLNVLEAVRAGASTARVLVAGSAEVYGPVPAERLPVSEDEPVRPRNPYAVSKAAAELLAGMHREARDLAVVCTRAFNHAGPGQSDSYVVSALARQIAEAEARGGRSVTLMTGNTDVRRDFTDVRDVVRGYWLALDAGVPATYNVCSGRPVAIAVILAALAELTDLAVEQRTDPRLLREHEVMEMGGSHERLTAATGWRPEVPLERTLADTLEWWRAAVSADASRGARPVR